MKRLLLAVLFLWLVTLVVPGLRERVTPRAVEVGGWAGARLEGPLSPITDRYKRVQAETHLSRTSRLLVTQRNMGQRAPESHELPAFMTRNDIAPDGLDPWGVQYQIVQEPDSVAVMSAGPDGVFGTADDLVVRVRYSERARSRR
jgi:hypothetical protein